MDARHEQALENIVGQLRVGMNPEAIYLFGSHARGDDTPDSDLDLLVVVEDSDQPRHRRAQEARLLAGEKSVSKDILVFTRAEWTKGRRVACSLPTTVAREGRLLYERGNAC
jgi:predicted nucleotidyltransferase